MTLWVLGLNHQTAPMELRERASFVGDALPRALDSLRNLPNVNEAALLSTCNRTELYAETTNAQMLLNWLEQHRPGLQNHLYQYRDAAAVRHLFRVATGLDSMVLEESQILGQVKDSWSMARTHGTLGNTLDRLFQHSFSVAKHARTNTRIGTNPVSIASTAVRLAQDAFSPLNESTVLLIGAGETIQLAAKHLSRRTSTTPVNCQPHPRQSADAGQPAWWLRTPLTELNLHLAEADIIFSATAAPTPIVTQSNVESALHIRKRKPILLFDLAIPRDIETEVGTLTDAYLYTIDDLERAVEENRHSRREAAETAEAIIELQVKRYMDTLQAQAHQAPLRRLRTFGTTTRDELLTRARRQLANGRPAEEVLEQLAHGLTNRLLHPPTAALREAALANNTELVRAAEQLFPEKPGYHHPTLQTTIVKTDETDPAS